LEKLPQWGLKYEHTDIRDQIRESEFRDSLGFMIRPPNIQDFSEMELKSPSEAPAGSFPRE